MKKRNMLLMALLGISSSMFGHWVRRGEMYRSGGTRPSTFRSSTTLTWPKLNQNTKGNQTRSLTNSHFQVKFCQKYNINAAGCCQQWCTATGKFSYVSNNGLNCTCKRN